MAALAENIGLMFRIKADSTDAVRDLNKVQNEIKGVGTSAATAGGGMAALANPAALAATAIAAVGTAAIVAAKYLFDLTNAASEYGSKIKDATLKSGASVETIQALGFAAQQSGGSLEAIAGSVAKFSTLLGQAQLGNEKAQATLAQFGITAKDVDGALVQAIESISKMTDSTLQNAAAAALFKDRGGEVVKTIREMGGNLPDTIKKLQDLGIMLSKEDTEAADAFGDSLALLSTQIKTTGYKFAFEFMPQITSSIRQIIQWLSANSAEVRKWGQVFAEVISGIKTYFGGLLTGINAAMNGINTAFGLSARNAITWSTVMQGALGPIVYLFRQLAKVGDSVTGSITSGTESAIDAVKPFAMPTMPTLLNAGGGNSPKAGRADNSAEREAEQRARREAAAEMQGALNNLKRDQQELTDEITKSLEAYEGLGRTDDLLEQVGQEIERITANITAQLAQIERLENQNRATNTEQENLLLTQEQLMRQEATKIEIDKEVARIKAEVAKKDKDVAEEYEKALKRAIELNYERLEQEREKIRVMREQGDVMIETLAKIDPALQQQPMGDGGDVTPYGPFQSWIDGWNQFVEQVNATAPSLEQTVQGIGGMFVNAFAGMANAIGSVVEQWVLMGSTGPAIMRKILAAALASIAAEAAVRAIWELALGFATLFTNPSESTGHFIAAALFGSVAVGAGLAGRAIAGDSFKRQTATATGGAGASSSQNSGQGSAGKAGVYSGQEDMTVERGRNTPGRFAVDLIVRSRDAFADMFAFEIGKNGRLRSAIQEAAAA